jgi:hypothetical protein
MIEPILILQACLLAPLTSRTRATSPQTAGRHGRSLAHYSIISTSCRRQKAEWSSTAGYPNFQKNTEKTSGTSPRLQLLHLRCTVRGGMAQASVHGAAWRSAAHNSHMHPCLRSSQKSVADGVSTPPRRPHGADLTGARALESQSTAVAWPAARPPRRPRPPIHASGARERGMPARRHERAP